MLLLLLVMHKGRQQLLLAVNRCVQVVLQQLHLQQLQCGSSGATVLATATAV
jgi:hypothetical protein